MVGRNPLKELIRRALLVVAVEHAQERGGFECVEADVVDEIGQRALLLVSERNGNERIDVRTDALHAVQEIVIGLLLRPDDALGDAGAGRAVTDGRAAPAVDRIGIGPEAASFELFGQRDGHIKPRHVFLR